MDMQTLNMAMQNIERKKANKNNVLVDFSFIFDTAFGSVAYLIDSYKNSKFFKPNMYTITPYFLRCLLITRTDPNPLSVLFKPEYLNSIDDIYKQLVDDKWNDVLKLSPSTDIGVLLTTMSSIGYNIDVNCRNVVEANRISSISFATKWNTVIEPKSIHKYSSIFVYDCEKLLKYPKVEGKTLYLFDQRLNIVDDNSKLPNDLGMVLYRLNNIYTVSPYKDFILPQEFIQTTKITTEDMEEMTE